MIRTNEPGRLTRAAVHSDAGEVEVRLSAAGNWQLTVRAAGEREWRLACSGDLEAGSAIPTIAAGDELTRYGKILIDYDRRRVLVDAREVKLSTLEFDLIAYLASEPNRVFTKPELMEAVWGYEDLRTTRTLDTHASRIRCTLRRAGAVGYIINVKRLGYNSGPNPRAERWPAPTISSPSVSGPPPRQTRKERLAPGADPPPPELRTPAGVHPVVTGPAPGGTSHERKRR